MGDVSVNNPPLFFDHAATTPLHPEVLDAMQPFLTTHYGNPSSIHRMGAAARTALSQARTTIAKHVEAHTEDDILFTSGGTEANNLALKGLAYGLVDKGKHIITSQVEHPAILETTNWLSTQGWEITYLPVDTDGFVSPADLQQALRSDTVLVSIMHGNNEVGTLQPIETLGKVTQDHGALFHTDAVQTMGKYPLILRQLPVDLLSCSGHKLFGPKGTGFLYATAHARQQLQPLLHGGGQESSYRSGTENLAGIAGLSKAIDLAYTNLDHTSTVERDLQQQLLEGILKIAPEAILNGPRNLDQRVIGNVNVSFPPVEGEALVLRFDLKGICLSSGSACHSAQLNGSHVLHAMGKPDNVAKSSLRFSLGRYTTQHDIETVLQVLPNILDSVGYVKSSPMHPSPVTMV